MGDSVQSDGRPVEDRQRGIDAGARAHIDKGEFYQGTLLDRISELLAV